MFHETSERRVADVARSDLDDEASAMSVSIAHSRWRSPVLARVVSSLVLLVTLYGIVQTVTASYYAFTDAFVAPLILSPDSDMVLSSKVNLMRLQAERTALVGRIDQASAVIHAAEQGDRKLAELRDAIRQGLEWAESVTSSSVRFGSLDVSRLAEQSRLIQGRVAEQAAFVRDLERQLAAGLVHKADVMRERDSLNQLRVYALQNEREKSQSSSQLEHSQLAARALHDRSGSDGGKRALSTPEVLQHRDQLTRLDVDLLKLEAERYARTSELRNARYELSKLDALIEEMMARPVFRAIESRQVLAFVPYTQLSATRSGADVFECLVWGLVGCRKVGTVTQLLPAEVAAQDPWGSVSRGQYALLKLVESDAAKAKVLRVRSGGTRERFVAALR